MDYNKTFFEIIKNYLRSNTSRVALIFDVESHDCVHYLLVEESPPGSVVLCKIEEISAFLAGKYKIDEWVTFSLLDEESLRRALTSNLAAADLLPAKITSCLNDLLIRYLSRDLAVSPDVPWDSYIPDLPVYAVVCTPRSGSTFLVEMLASVGLGRPEEHLRAQEIAALSDLHIGERDAVLLLTEFIWRNQRNFVFGTKVISHFLFSLLSKGPIVSTVYNYVQHNFRVVYLIRKDKVGQALSDFLANKSLVWHVRNAESSQALSNKHLEIEYSFEDILRRYKFMVEQECKLTSYVQGINHLVYFFEDLVAEPQAVVGSVAKFLGFKDIGMPTATVIRTESAVNALLRERFVSDFRARFNSDPEEYVPHSSLKIASGALIPSDDLLSLTDLRSLKSAVVPPSIEVVARGR